LIATVASTQAADWPQWRGPNFNGSTDETGLPEQWSQTTNIAWQVDLPGPSAATPIVLGDRVFVSTTDMGNETLKAICLDRRTGDVIWEHTVAKGLKKDTRSNFATPSPATDGNLVVFFYGNGDLVTYDLSGHELWSKNIGPFAFGWTFSTSPVLYDGKLYMQVLQRDVAVDGRGSPTGNESYLLALDPKTGQQLFRQVRPSSAVAESLEAFTTPTPYEFNGRKQILVAGGDALSGHDPATGKENWRWGTWNPGREGHWRLVPSPVAGEGIALACGPKKSPIYAVHTEGAGRLSDDDGLAWVSRRQRSVSSDVPTPAFYDADFFVLSDVTKSLSRVEPKSGRVKWTVDTPGRIKYEASPLVADGKVYAVNFDAQVSIFDAEDGKLKRTIDMESGPADDVDVRSSIIASHGQLFIRTTSKLYCVGK
jgi:outer membrane protein assembly factor BamB